MANKFLSIVFLCILIISCHNDLDQIFVNENVKNLFFEYVEEAEVSSYRDGDKIFISVYSKISNEDWCMSFDNSQYYPSEDKYGKFNYKGFKVFVNESVPKSIIKLDKYNFSGNYPPPENFVPHPKEFLEMYICFQHDSLNVMRINYRNENYLNVWKTILKKKYL